MVETSNVGVKVGMVGRGVMDAVGVGDGSGVVVGDGVSERVIGWGRGVTCPQAVRNRIPLSIVNAICFMCYLPNI